MKSIKIYLIGIMAIFAGLFLNAQTSSGIQQAKGNVNAVTTADMLALYPDVQGTAYTAYFYLNTQGRKFSALTATLYKNARELAPLKTVDLLPLLPDNTFSTAQIFSLEWNTADAVAIINGTYADDGSAYKSATFENTQQYVNFNDIAPAAVNGTSTPVSAVTGWGTLGINKAVEAPVLNIAGQSYTLGYGIHANGWLKCVFPAGVYNRFVADVGKQNGLNWLILFNLKKNNVQTATTGSVLSSVKTVWDYPLENNVTSVQIDVNIGSDHDWADHGSIGAPRLYYALPQKNAQTVSWASASQTVHNYKPFQLPLTAVATSGLAPLYRVKQGAEYASIVNGNMLNVTKIPETSAVVEVEALQPGNAEWAAAPIAFCRITLTNGLIIQKNETAILQNGDNISHLTIYADENSAGQAYVTNGFANVDKFTLKYTFTPGKWRYISFPASADLQKISDLAALGYTLGTNTGAADKPYYFIREFDPAQAQSPNNSEAWHMLASPLVGANKGYLMAINDFAGGAPKEVTFTFDNRTVDFSSLQILNLTLDMSAMAANAVSDVYVSPANVKGNTLKVAVKYEPTNVPPRQLNHAQALQEARFTYNALTREARLTLPDEYPAKIAIYKNKAMTKLYKAVKYISPMAIDLSGLKRGTYPAIVQYGDAVEVKEIVIK